MEWRLEDRENVVVMEMRSNPVNKQNDAFLSDLTEAFDRLDRHHPHKAVLLIGSGKIFSAGLDLDPAFARFARADEKEVSDWLLRYQTVLLRVFTAPRPTIAAVNGHAFAGGLVLALCCDFRIGVEGDFRFALNEVAIGVPMPAAFCELIRYRIGDPAAAETILLAKAYGVADAKHVGFLHDAVSQESLLETGIKWANHVPLDALAAYRTSKKALLHPVLRRIETDCVQLDKETHRVMVLPESIRAQQAALQKLRDKRA